MQKETFEQICQTLNTLEKTSSRNEMTEILSNTYKKLNNKDAQILSYLVTGRVAPIFVNSEFNYSEKSFIALLSNILSIQNIKQDISKLRKETGDIGDTLENISTALQYKSQNILLEETYEILWQIVNTTGTGSIEKKNTIIINTLQKLSPLEAKYFSRIICGSLRLGINTKTLIDVLSYTISGTKETSQELTRAYGVYADIGYITSIVIGQEKNEISKILSKVKVEVGIPIQPRLVERVSSFQEVFDRLGNSFLVQNKYDGLRCQIHKIKKNETLKKELIWSKYMQKENRNSLFDTKEDEYIVKLFTRNLEDVTQMFPEIVEEARNMPEESFILDSEILGWNEEKGTYLTFQETMQRRRKYGIKDLRKSIPVRAMVFDILYKNGEDLLHIDTKKRIGILNTSDTKGNIYIEETEIVDDLEELNDAFENAIALGHEGIIVKQFEGGYRPGTRNFEWIKLKKSMLKKLVDSIDLVAVGYSIGSGRRQSMGVGSVLGAIYNEIDDTFEAICNVGTGFSDEQLKEVFENLSKKKVSIKPKNVLIEDDLNPDVWVDPSIVFTVEADEITQKMGSEFLSLRFPRLIEWNRDKSITDATSKSEILSMYNSRKRVEKGM